MKNLLGFALKLSCLLFLFPLPPYSYSITKTNNLINLLGYNNKLTVALEDLALKKLARVCGLSDHIFSGYCDYFSKVMNKVVQ